MDKQIIDGMKEESKTFRNIMIFYRIWIKSVITSISWNYSSTMRSGPYRNTGNYFSLNRNIQ